MINANEQLISAACSGDKDALNELLHVCQVDLRRFARRTCSHHEDIEDAVQITLWQLHKKIGTLKTIATFSSWLFRIIERECYRLFRKRSLSHDENFEIDEISSPINDVDLRIDLANIIITMPLHYRQVLIMRDIEEYTAPEVAEKLNITIDAVKSRLYRARLIIKEQLAHHEHFIKNTNGE